MRLVTTARDLAKRLIRSLTRRSIYTQKSRSEGQTGPFTRMLGLEDDIELGAREEWDKHLSLWDLDNPVQRKQILRIIQSASDDAFADVRRSFSGTDDPEIAMLIDAFARQFEPADLLVAPAQVKA